MWMGRPLVRAIWRKASDLRPRMVGAMGPRVRAGDCQVTGRFRDSVRGWPRARDGPRWSWFLALPPAMGMLPVRGPDSNQGVSRDAETRVRVAFLRWSQEVGRVGWVGVGGEGGGEGWGVGSAGGGVVGGEVGGFTGFVLGGGCGAGAGGAEAERWARSSTGRVI
jgi:hypothetical protein